MTIIEAINRIDAIKPNGYPQTEKVRWLNTIDALIKTNIIDTHHGAEKVSFDGYNEDTNLNTELLVPSPYDEIYLYWLESKIDYWNGEMGRYNNSISMYNTTYTEYEKAYNRTHMPIGRQMAYFGKPNTPEWQAANGVVKVEIEEA